MGAQSLIARNQHLCVQAPPFREQRVSIIYIHLYELALAL